jgi:hypothetical protein
MEKNPMKRFLLAAVLAFGMVFAVPASFAQRAEPAPGEEPPPPPYLAYGAHNLLIRFEADETAIRNLLPPGLEPASNVITLNMYIVPHGLGIPPYTRSYIWVDLKGFDAWDGTRGRYVLVGWAEPDGFRAVATGLLHWPAEQGVTHIEPDGAGEVRATLRVGDADLIVARASRAEGAVGKALANLLPYIFVDEAVLAANRPVKRKDVGVNQVPFTGTALELKPLSIDFRVPDDHRLASLRPKRLVEAIEVRDGTFALGVIGRATALE